MVYYNIKVQYNVFGKEKEGYGYGIWIVDQKILKYIGYIGLGDGFFFVNLYFFESDVSLIILENQMNVDWDLLYSIEIKIKNIFLESDLLN